MEAMTVEQLIVELQTYAEQCGPNTPVHFSYNYGDHGRTTVAPGAWKVSEERIVYSDYHDLPKVLDKDDDRFFDPERHTQVIVISG